MPPGTHIPSAAVAAVDVVLMRHGRSTANERGIYTGWGDAPLSATGRAEVRHAAQELRADGVHVDVVHTSLLTRAQQSTHLLLRTWQYPAPLIHGDWRLNERHLGLIQGLTRAQVISRWGNPARQSWRSNPTAVPPAVSRDSPEHPANQARYRHVPASLLPGAESLDELTSRVLAYWHTSVCPDIAAGRRVLVVAHRDTLRVIVSHLDNEPSACFANLTIHTAQTLRYRLDPRHPCTPT